MNKREILQSLLKGELPAARAKVELRGLTFFALPEEGSAGLYDVEVREHARPRERRQMTLRELEGLKPRCISWTHIYPDGGIEFIHQAKRYLHPYE